MDKKIVIDGKESQYLCNEFGEITDSITGKLRKTGKDGRVYLIIDGNKKGYMTSRLVASLFLEQPSKEYIYIKHIDGNKQNNTVSNLKWITARENAFLTWDKRRENNTTGAGIIRGSYNKENIVEINYSINENEKQIEIDGIKTPYAVSKDGKVRNLKTNNILKGSLLNGYRYIALRYNGRQKNKGLHQLVALAFLPNPNGYSMVDHIDGDRENNSIENLRWVDAKMNSANIHQDSIWPVCKHSFRPTFSKEELAQEIWKEQDGYKISNLGNIIGRNGRTTNGSVRPDGYVKYDGKLVHTLVWEAFNGRKKDNYVLNHINGNKADNRLSNLEMVTQKENMQKASIETNAWNFKKVGEYDINNNLLRIFPNASEAARNIGILPSSMRNSIRKQHKCFNGLYYKYIE